jgi:hypothetical protein
MFELEPTENVMDDFVCALKKRILLQGRMYVFEHYVCFHSNVLGYVKNKIIPLKVTLGPGSDHDIEQNRTRFQLSQWLVHQRDHPSLGRRASMS